MCTHQPTESTAIRVGYLDGSTRHLDPDTPIYVESWEDAHGARSDDGSLRAIEDLVPAGRIGNPDILVAGRDLDPATPYVYYVGDGQGLAAPVAILPTETTETTETTEAAEVAEAAEATITLFLRYIHAWEEARDAIGFAHQHLIPGAKFVTEVTQAVDRELAGGALLLARHGGIDIPRGDDADLALDEARSRDDSVGTAAAWVGQVLRLP